MKRTLRPVYIHISLTLFTALLLAGPVFSQDRPITFRFESLELPNGELGNHVQSVAQDSFGFMWFGSQYGLHRWDGYQYRTYVNDPADSTSISVSYVEFIYVARDSTLWLGTWGGGLNHFDPRTELFTHYLFDKNDPETISNNFVTEILEDREGYLWVTTQDGVNRFDRKAQKFKRFFHDPDDPTSLSYSICRSAFIDSDGILWFGTGWAWEDVPNGGLNRYHPKTESFTRYLHDPEDPKSISSNKVFDIYEDSSGRFWIAADGDGLNLMDRKTGTFRHFTNKEGVLSAPFLQDTWDDHMKFIFEDRDHRLWLGSWEGGLKFYNPETGQSQHFHVGSHGSTIHENYPWNMMQSRDGTLWGWTAYNNARVFKVIPEELFLNYHGLSAGMLVRSFFEEEDNKLWIGSHRFGLRKWIPSHQKIISYLNDPYRPIENYYDNEDLYDLSKRDLFDDIYKIVMDSEGFLWFASGANYMSKSYLLRMHPETGAFQQFQLDPDAPSGYFGKWIMDMTADVNKRIWIATEDGVLYRVNPSGKAFEAFVPPNPKVLQDKGHFGVINASMDGSIWFFGTHGPPHLELPYFLYRLDPQSETFKTFDINQDMPITAMGEIIEMKEDSSGYVWLLTTRGLHRLDPVTNVTTHWHLNSFGASQANGFVIDNEGRLWILCDGLVVFNPKNEMVFKYNADNGIKTLPFSWRSIYKSPSGRIFLGGRGGFHYFYPENILGSSDERMPDLLITDFELPQLNTSPGKFLIFSKAFQENPVIELGHNQNVFTFRFAILDFLQPRNNRHEFFLEGYDDNWRHAGLEPLATYIKVPPGDYTFRVRGANHLGVWSDTHSIQLHIAHPWWSTGYAYALFIIGALALIFAVYRFQLTRQLAQSEALRLKELDAAKTLLYTNITHEFRTPLTVILGMARQVLNEPGTHFRQGMHMIIRNGENLLHLVNQMLDLSKLEGGKTTLRLVQQDVITFLKYLIESYHSYAGSHGIQIHFLADTEGLTMDYDADKLQQIIMNLLSNAVKFTPEGGHIYVQVSTLAQRQNGSKDSKTKDTMVIAVRDTGKGIPEADLPYVFDRFYQVADTGYKEREGSGIGLALTRELVNLMGGSLSVKSQLGAGTEFIIHLPVRHTAPLHEQVTIKLPEVSFPGMNKEIKSADVPVPESPATNPAIPQLLLIEDNPDVVQYLTFCLTGAYRLHIAQDGQEGIDLATEIIPDLIVSDIMMPQKDGFEVCDFLKNDQRTSHIPIILLTAKAGVESKLEGLKKGADAYLAKPFQKEELLVRIEMLLELRRKLQSYYLSLSGRQDSTLPVKDIPDIEKTEDYFVRKVHKYVEDNLDNFDLSVEQLCREIGLSNSQLHRKLSAVTGLSATRFIRYIRLNHARELLKDPDLSVTAVAFDTGFNDPSYFGRVFKKEFGVTPVEWREKTISPG